MAQAVQSAIAVHQPLRVAGARATSGTGIRLLRFAMANLRRQPERSAFASPV